ncbi:MAG: CYTH domain-containing protein [Candidatus Taylorbacteria bacterium]
MEKTFEVEIKTLLGSKENALALKAGLKKLFPEIALVSSGKQLNHYFNNPAKTDLLVKNLEQFIPAEKTKAFEHILTHGTKMSIRTRDADGTVIFVIKASVGGDTSSNGVTRIEFESVVPLSLDKLDRILLDSGCTYQAKWSREREEYGVKDLHVCIDKNAGYGYLAEFEKVTTDEASLGAVKKDLFATMEKLGVSELPQDRLERMFAHYNANWQTYYGTDKTFTIQ